MVGAPGHGFSLREHVSYWSICSPVLVLVASFFTLEVPRAPADLVPAPAILSGTPGPGLGIILMLASLILFIIGFTMGGLN